VIKFVGNYAASKGQAAALVLYVFFGVLLASAQCMRLLHAIGLMTYVHSTSMFVTCAGADPEKISSAP
jgi:hypothetical protein